MEHGITAAKFAQEYVNPYTPGDSNMDQVLPLCTGPIVTIRIGNTSYNVSKEILCKSSAYFSAMFNGCFAEATDQSAKLEPVEGVVSPRSLEALLRWVYCGHGRPGNGTGMYCERIAVVLEFLRFADIAGVAVDEARAAAQIREAMVREPVQTGSYRADAIERVSVQNIRSASHLRRGHPVRVVFAQAAAAALVTSRSFKFQKEVEEIPEFKADVLRELAPLLVKASSGEGCLGLGPTLVEFVDPFTQQRMGFDGRIKIPSNRGNALYDGYCRMSVG